MKSIKFMVKTQSLKVASMLFIGVLFFLSNSLLGQQEKNMPAHNLISKQKISDVSDLDWERLAQKKIFFGHQSVGENIVSGLHLLVKENPKIKLSILKSNTKSDYTNAVFGHSEIGKNEFPQTKNNEFSRIISSDIGDNIDVAFYKYCYIDINNETDITSLFESYKKNIEKLKSQRKSITFVHITVPLTTVSNSPMVFVRKILGRNIWGFEENKRRNEFNKLLMNEYAGVDPVFDLAKLESTTPKGDRITYTHDGTEYFSMDPGYASDRSHLNEAGQRYIAEQMLVFLAGLH